MQNHVSCPADISNLVDIRSVKVNAALPVPIKKKSFIRQIGNPQCYRYDDIKVRVRHMDTEISLADRIQQLMLSGQGMDLIL